MHEKKTRKKHIYSYSTSLSFTSWPLKKQNFGMKYKIGLRKRMKKDMKCAWNTARGRRNCAKKLGKNVNVRFFAENTPWHILWEQNFVTWSWWDGIRWAEAEVSNDCGDKKYLRELLRGWARIRIDGLNLVLKKICQAFESVHRWCIFTH